MNSTLGSVVPLAMFESHLGNLLLLGHPLEMILQSDIEVEAVRPIRETDSDEGASTVVVHYLDHKIPEEEGGLQTRRDFLPKLT